MRWSFLSNPFPSSRSQRWVISQQYSPARSSKWSPKTTPKLWRKPKTKYTWRDFMKEKWLSENSSHKRYKTPKSPQETWWSKKTKPPNTTNLKVQLFLDPEMTALLLFATNGTSITERKDGNNWWKAMWTTHSIASTLLLSSTSKPLLIGSKNGAALVVLEMELSCLLINNIWSSLFLTLLSIWPTTQCLTFCKETSQEPSQVF